MESNVQKMMEAFGEIILLCQERDYPVGELVEIEKIAEKAKSIPLRNCDMGTAEERMYRYNRLREEIKERYERLGEIPPSFAFPTAFEWEDSPYEAAEGSGGKVQVSDSKSITPTTYMDDPNAESDNCDFEDNEW